MMSRSEWCSCKISAPFLSGVFRMHAQFEHLAETYFDGFDHDIGERELGYSQSCDNDLDMVLASIGLTKTALQSIVGDDGKFL